MDEEKPFYKRKKGIVAIICISFVALLLFGSIGSILSPEKDKSFIEEKIYFGDNTTCKVSAQVTNITKLVMKSKELDTNQKIVLNYNEFNEAIDEPLYEENPCVESYSSDVGEKEKYVSITISRVNSKVTIFNDEKNNYFESSSLFNCCQSVSIERTCSGG